MKKIFLSFLGVFVLVFSFAFPAQASTNITSDILADTHWTLANSPYIVQNSVSVVPGYTLTIDSGVVMKFNTDVSLAVAGTLDAVGTSAQPILFTSNSISPKAGDWHGLIFYKNDSHTSLENIHIEYAKDGIETIQSNFSLENIAMNDMSEFGLIDSNSSSLALSNANFKNVVTGIELFNQSSLSVADSIFDSGSTDGIDVFNGSSLSLSNVVIKNFSKYGIQTFGNSDTNTLSFSKTRILNNHKGIGVFDAATFSADTSSIADNAFGVEIYSPNFINLQNIWWGDATGPKNETSNPSGLGNEITDNIEFSPWLTENPFPDDAPKTPDQYYAKIIGFSSGFANLRATPSANGELIKTLPNDWVVKVIQKTSNNQPVIADGYQWYKVEDSTDGTQLWMIAMPENGSKAIYLPYDEKLQSDLQNVTQKLDGAKNLASRTQTIVDAVDHYFSNTDTKKSIYSSDDHSLKISKLVDAGFSENLILGIIAQEDGDLDHDVTSFNNENVSADYGHGVTQVTMDAQKNEQKGYSFTNNASDPRGILSEIHLNKCTEMASDEYKKCYQHTDDYNSKLKSYDYYEHSSLNPKYKEYSNTIQSLYSNIKDGLGVLTGKYKHVFENSCNHAWVAGGLTFTCDEIRKIKAIWGYNGAVTFSDRNYLSEVSGKLKILQSYFPGHVYDNSDNFIDKLVYANNHRTEIKVHSPVELRVTDSSGNVTGLVNGAVETNIPNSTYDPESETALILFPDDTYTYQVVGDGTGPSYGFDVTPEGASTPAFIATDIPIGGGEIHTYHVDETLLAEGKNGVTLDIDKNGDGIPEKEIVVGATLTDIIAPAIDTSLLTSEYSLGEKINLKDLVTDNISKFKDIVLKAFWDTKDAEIPISGNKIALPSIGNHSLILQATDEAGNMSESSKQMHMSYIFKGFKAPLADGSATVKKNKKVNIRFRLASKSGILIPVTYPTLSITKVNDGTKAKLDKNDFDEDPDCDAGDECFTNHHNRYLYKLDTSILSTGDWKIKLGLEDGSQYTTTLTIN